MKEKIFSYHQWMYAVQWWGGKKSEFKIQLLVFLNHLTLNKQDGTQTLSSHIKYSFQNHRAFFNLRTFNPCWISNHYEISLLLFLIPHLQRDFSPSHFTCDVKKRVAILDYCIWKHSLIVFWCLINYEIWMWIFIF